MPIARVEEAMQRITPCLWFDHDAEAAVERYTGVFDDASVGHVSHYDAASAAVSGRPEGSVLTVDFELEGYGFVALNGGPGFEFTPATSFIVGCSTAEDVHALWAELAHGEALMPLDAYPFSDRYGWTEDAFGLSWQLLHDDEASVRTIVPSLLFVGERCGQAEAAIEFYASVFPDSAVGEVARYGPDAAPNEPDGVTYADVTLAGQRFAAMDSALAHNFDFTEAVSFVVDCADQAEVDRYWTALTADGGTPGQCGWLSDRFGVSWQVVPAVLPELLRHEDEAAAGRVMAAILEMGKLDVEALEAAAAG